MYTEVVVKVDERGADTERLAELANALRTELLAFGADDVKPLLGGRPPLGARGFDEVTAGALLASLKGSAEVMSHLVATIRSWLRRSDEAVPRMVELTIGDKTLKVTAAASEQQDRLIEAFISAVARSQSVS